MCQAEPTPPQADSAPLQPKAVSAETSRRPSKRAVGMSQSAPATPTKERAPREMDQQVAERVSALLEAMNLASSSINSCEKRLENAQERYKRRVEHFEKLYRALRLEYGRSFEEAKPYFDTTHKLKEASRRLQGIAGELSSAPEEENPRHCERYAQTLQACREAKETLGSLRARIGDAAIRSTKHCFALLEHHQEVLAEEHLQLQHLEGAARAAKDSYCQSLRSLEQLSDGMHTARNQAVEVY